MPSSVWSLHPLKMIKTLTSSINKQLSKVAPKKSFGYLWTWLIELLKLTKTVTT
jgi:hypothetical protein